MLTPIDRLIQAGDTEAMLTVLLRFRNIPIGERLVRVGLTSLRYGGDDE